VSPKHCPAAFPSSVRMQPHSALGTALKEQIPAESLQHSGQLPMTLAELTETQNV
jgi:hypothetical protein